MDHAEPAFLYHRTPAAIREVTFAHRLRGLDEDEVYEFLDLLADQVQAADTERAALLAEVERLRAEHAGEAPHQADPQAAGADPEVQEANPQAVALLSQAQQVADLLVDEAVQHAREVLGAAYSERREILRRAHETAAAALREPADDRSGHDTAHRWTGPPPVLR